MKTLPHYLFDIDIKYRRCGHSLPKINCRKLNDENDRRQAAGNTAPLANSATTMLQRTIKIAPRRLYGLEKSTLRTCHNTYAGFRKSVHRSRTIEEGEECRVDKTRRFTWMKFR